MIGSPGTGVQHLAMRTSTFGSIAPSTTTPYCDDEPTRARVWRRVAGDCSSATSVVLSRCSTLFTTWLTGTLPPPIAT